MISIQLLVALLILTCGPAVLWWRRDNVLAYLSAGFFVSVYVIPIFPILSRYRSDQATVRLYADILAAGAVAFALGLFLGRQIAVHGRRKLPLTFDKPMTSRLVDLVTRRARWIGAGGLFTLLLAFLIMGYVPFFAADRVSAKYGVGPYRPSFERAALIYRFGLAAAAAILPVLLAVFWRTRKVIDLVLAVAIVCALGLSLSRDAAFVGPLGFATAVLVERRFRPWLIATALVAVFSVGAVVSILFVQQADQLPRDTAARIAASTADIRDHLGFLRAYEQRQDPTYGRTLLAGLGVQRSDWDPSAYALRTYTGLSDLSELAAGGLRLPPPLWGYVSFGWPGVAMFAALSGVFTGWGFERLKRLLTPALGAAGLALNLTLAVLFYDATYGVLAEFYFLNSSLFVKIPVAIAVTVAIRFVFVRAHGGAGGGGVTPGRRRALAAVRGPGGTEG